MKRFQWFGIFSLTLSMAAFTVGCGGTMKSSLQHCASGCEGDLGSGDGVTPPDHQNELPSDMNIKFNPKIEGSNFAGQSVMSFDTQNGFVIVRVPLPPHGIHGGVYGEVLVPEVPGMKVTFDNSNVLDSSLRVHIPIEAIVGDLAPLDPARLPSGDPIPQVPGGELPAIAVQVSPNPDLKVIIYLGAEYIGVYFLNPDMIDNRRLRISIPLKDEGHATPVGYLHIIPDKVSPQFPNGDGTGGFFLAIQLPPEVSIILEELL